MTRTSKPSRVLLYIASIAVAACVSIGVPTIGHSGGLPDLNQAGGKIGGGEKDAALIVAITDYYAVQDVPGAVANANAWKVYLRKMLKVPSVRVLRDGDATNLKIEKYTREQAAKVKPGGTFWFVFIGHGAPSPDGSDAVLVGVDATGDTDGLYARSVARNKLLKIVDAGRKGRSVWVFDSCFSGKDAQGTALVPGAQPLIPLRNKGLEGKRRVVFTAGKSDQFAGPLPGTQRPAMSYLLLGALRGWGDGDGDGKVTPAEAHRYVHDTLDDVLTGRTQTPELWGGQGQVLSAGRERAPDIDQLLTRKGPSGSGDFREENDFDPGPNSEVVVQFTSRPAGAVVMVDGAMVCRSTPCSRAVSAGMREVEMQLELHLTRRVTMDLINGQRLEWRLEEAFGRVEVVARPGVPLNVNDKPAGQTPLKDLRLPPGRHNLSVTDACWLKLNRSVEVKSGQRTRLELDANPRPSGLKVKAVDIDGNDVLAEVYVDGQQVGMTPGVFKVGVCSKKMEVRHDLLGSIESALSLKANQTEEVRVRYEGKRPAFVDRMVKVPGGKFLRGSSGDDDERPRREVTLDGFWIDKYEVTVSDYEVCVDGGGCSEPSKSGKCNWGKSSRGDHPVNCVDWTQAAAFCRWKGKRLPTEAEWEKAARGMDGREYPWGNEAPSCKRAVMSERDKGGCGRDGTWPVGSKAMGVSPYGVYDMAGNVWEWTADWYGSSYYRNAPARNPRGPSHGQDRIRRGGSWDASGPAFRSAFRSVVPPTFSSSFVGLRCAR